MAGRPRQTPAPRLTPNDAILGMLSQRLYREAAALNDRDTTGNHKERIKALIRYLTAAAELLQDDEEEFPGTVDLRDAPL